MARLYWGLKRWQWGAVFAIATANLYLTTDDLLDPVAIVSGIIVLVPMYYIASRIVVGVYRYVKYTYFDDPIYRNPKKVDRERKYAYLVSGLSIFAILSVVVVLAAPTLMGYDDVDSDNPYRDDTLVVGIEGSEMKDASREIVSEALEYWERGDRTDHYAGYPIDYELRPNTDDPDMVVKWEDSIDQCGYHDNVSDAVGCAHLITGDAPVPDPVVVRLDANRPNRETTVTLKHELGHTLGLTHDDEPQEVMSIENRTES